MISEIRGQIYDFFHSNEACQNFFYKPQNEEKYVAYYTSMYLLADTTESLSAHRATGFSKNPLRAYLEFWGIMQAIIIQQDSICELYESVKGKKLDTKELTSWMKLRFLRNTCAGHPVKRNRPKSKPQTRTFMGRNFGGYKKITYEKWEKPESVNDYSEPLKNISHPEVKLDELISSYEKEAVQKLQHILEAMKTRWPNT
ncbi:MAG: hypothetical protein V6Z89_13155 [Desulfobacter sp.]